MDTKNGYGEDNGSTNGVYSTAVQTNLVTCASSDTTGSSGLQNIAFSTTNFENVTSGSEDFHIKSGSSLNGGGTDISGDTNWLSTDYDGENWDSTPSIGAYEYIAAGGGNAYASRLTLLGVG
jgi:hypothetical protein